MYRSSAHFLMDEAPSGAAPAAPAAAPAAPAAPTPAATLLSAAASAAAPVQPGAAPAAQPGADPLASVPAKYRVNTADGKLDAAATLAKVNAAHAQLETRLGEGGAPPDKPEGYKPDAVYAALKTSTGKDVTLPPEFLGDFNKFAHEAKLSQGQYDKALTGMIGMTQKMVDQSFDHAMKTGQAALEKVWGNDAKDPKSERMQNAFKAFTRFAPENMRNAETMDAIGNHPVVMQVLEAVGRELKSDRSPNEQGGQAQGATRLDQIYSDKAYWNAKDPRHAALVSEANGLFAKGFKPTAMKGRGGTVTL